MNIEECYLQFLQLVNRNATNNNINVDRPRFVLLFNDIQNRYLEWNLEKRNEDSIRYVSHLLVTNKTLTGKEEKEDRNIFKLPSDYFDHSNLHAFGSKGNCKDKRLKTFEIKSDDSEEILSDINSKPSFEFREVPYFIAQKKVHIFIDKFSISKANLTYYRYPEKVDIKGYVKQDGTDSTSIDPDFDDKAIGRILVAMGKEFQAINSEGNEYQLSKDRLFSQI